MKTKRVVTIIVAVFASAVSIARAESRPVENELQKRFDRNGDRQLDDREQAQLEEFTRTTARAEQMRAEAKEHEEIARKLRTESEELAGNLDRQLQARPSESPDRAGADKDAFWDGTIILIQRSRSDFLSQVITDQMKWKTAVAIAQCWYTMGNASECSNQIISYSSAILNRRLQNLKGGCDFDCVPNGQVCNTLTLCDTDDDCEPGKIVCASQVVGSICVATSWGILPCTDGLHRCMKTSTQDDYCINKTGLCAIMQHSSACNVVVQRCSGLFW